MTALASLALAGALQAAPPAYVAPPPDAPPLDVGRLSLAVGVGAPAHFAATGAVLAFACSGAVIGARCDRSGIEGSGGARAATWLLLATLPPLASGAVVWALGDDDAAPASLPWTLAGGAVGQALGFGLALATGSPAVGVLSLTAFPVAGEIAGLLATRTPVAPVAPAAQPVPISATALASDGAWLVPIAAASF
jgi:hypothetical protein